MAFIDGLMPFIHADTLLTNKTVFCCRLEAIPAHQSPCVWSEWRECGAEVGPTREPCGGDKLHHHVQKGRVKGFILTGTVLLCGRFINSRCTCTCTSHVCLILWKMEFQTYCRFFILREYLIRNSPILYQIARI